MHAHARAELQKTITQLATKYRAKCRGLGSDAEKLLTAYQQDSEDANLKKFVLLLDSINKKGKAVNKANLANRLAHLA
jgi:hypothetical protein